MTSHAPVTRRAPGTPAPRTTPTRTPTRTPAPLTVVRTRPAQSRAPFVVLVAALLLGGLAALLMLNTALTQGAFHRSQATAEVKDLLEREQALRQTLAMRQEPRELAKQARELGLVPPRCPVFLRLPDAKVLGTPCAAVAPPRPPTPDEIAAVKKAKADKAKADAEASKTVTAAGKDGKPTDGKKAKGDKTKDPSAGAKPTAGKTTGTVKPDATTKAPVTGAKTTVTPPKTTGTKTMTPVTKAPATKTGAGSTASDTAR